MELLRLVGLCILCLGPLVLLRKSAPEQALLLTLATFGAGLVLCLRMGAPLLRLIQSVGQEIAMEKNHVVILIKAVGAALVTKIGTDLCRDGGSQTLAGLVELIGAVATVLLAVPLMEDVLSLLIGFYR